MVRRVEVPWPNWGQKENEDDFTDVPDRAAGPGRQARHPEWLQLQAVHLQELRLLIKMGRADFLARPDFPNSLRLPSYSRPFLDSNEDIARNTE
jgi:hypothetical protein